MQVLKVLLVLSCVLHQLIVQLRVDAEIVVNFLPPRSLLRPQNPRVSLGRSCLRNLTAVSSQHTLTLLVVLWSYSLRRILNYILLGFSY